MIKIKKDNYILLSGDKYQIEEAFQTDGKIFLKLKGRMISSPLEYVTDLDGKEIQPDSVELSVSWEPPKIDLGDWVTPLDVREIWVKEGQRQSLTSQVITNYMRRKFKREEVSVNLGKRKIWLYNKADVYIALNQRAS